MPVYHNTLTLFQYDREITLECRSWYRQVLINEGKCFMLEEATEAFDGIRTHG